MSLVDRDEGCPSTTYFVADNWAVGVDSFPMRRVVDFVPRYKLLSENGTTFASTTISCADTIPPASTRITLPPLHPFSLQPPLLLVFLVFLFLLLPPSPSAASASKDTCPGCCSVATIPIHAKSVDGIEASSWLVVFTFLMRI